MSSALARAHIAGQQRLRSLVAHLVEDVWTNLSGYDEENVPEFVERIVPVVLAAQRQSVALTEAFIARALERQPVGVPPEELVGGVLRRGAEPEHVYRRPFVTVWTALSEGVVWEKAVDAGRARAVSLATTDVQLAMRETLRALAER